MIDERGWDVYIEVDGGIKVDNIAEVAAAGANVFVSGSGVFGTKDYASDDRRAAPARRSRALSGLAQALRERGRAGTDLRILARGRDLVENRRGGRAELEDEAREPAVVLRRREEAFHGGLEHVADRSAGSDRA